MVEHFMISFNILLQ